MSYQGSSGWAWSLQCQGQIIQTVKYAVELVLMAKEETVLQGMINKLIETCRYYGMEINVEKNKSNDIFLILCFRAS